MENIIWNYGSEGAKLSAFISLAGTFFTFLLGGWDKPIQLLLVLMLFDFILGTLSALKTHTINSKVMFWGGINKVLVLMLVSLCVFIDRVIPIGEPCIRTAVIFFYCGREGLSLIENCGRLGMPLPESVKKFFTQLNRKGEEFDEDRGN